MQPLPRCLAMLFVLALLSACDVATRTYPSPPLSPSSTPRTIAVPSAAPLPTTILAPIGAAPDQPIENDTWVAGNKQGVGTAFTYDQPAGADNSSRVWFGITNGAISEGAFPDISQANIKSLSVLVSDGKSFLSDEMLDAAYHVERLDGRTPAFRVTSTDKQGRWAVIKEIVSDPRANTIVCTITFHALQGQASDYQLYVNYMPRIAQSGAGDLSMIENGVAEAWDTQAGVYTSLVSDPPPALLTTGYTGKSDLVTDLRDYRVDATYRTTMRPGRISIGLQIPVSGATTIALGFGLSQDQARAAASASLKRGFAAIAQDYQQGWARYLDALEHPYPSLPLFDASLAVLKTYEDKTHYGAFIAAFATPWGQFVSDVDPQVRGYRYVSARDIYHSVIALRLAGDESVAPAALAFMDERMQQHDGSFPQASFPDGAPYATGVQLDQTAMPIILAWQLNATDRYTSLVKPAADFISRSGPQTALDRWGESAAYAPATLAAEVAALVCAAAIATQAGDSSAAAQYLARADEWNAQIEQWTLTTNGPLSSTGYYLRNSTGNPNNPDKIALANQTDSFDQRTIVDPSFLELVRLGLRKPDDPHIMDTLAVIDATLAVKTPKGDAYDRYPHDGYGEHRLGDAPAGQGHLWPLLIGERSIYIIAQSHSEHPASWYLPVMSSMANQGDMLPEQVFDDGTGTGSATPLAWAHAEYIVFTFAVKQEAVPDLPAVVAARYTQ